MKCECRNDKCSHNNDRQSYCMKQAIYYVNKHYVMCAKCAKESGLKMEKIIE